MWGWWKTSREGTEEKEGVRTVDILLYQEQAQNLIHCINAEIMHQVYAQKWLNMSESHINGSRNDVSFYRHH